MSYLSAVPVWIAGDRPDMLDTVGFRTVFSAQPGGRFEIRLAASNVYRLWMNGKFVAYGPARCGRDTFRLETLDVSHLIQSGANLLAIEVVHFGVNSFSNLMEAPFLQAELLLDGRVVTATGPAGGFHACEVPGRVRKVQRLSYMRPFSEIYHLQPGWDRWRTRADARFTQLAIKELPAKSVIPRRSPTPEFGVRQPAKRLGRGTFSFGPPLEKPKGDRSLQMAGNILRGFPEKELASIPWLEYQRLKNTVVPHESPYSAGSPELLSSGECMRVDMGVNWTGLIGVKFKVEQQAKIWLAFDEILLDGKLDATRLGMVAIVEFELQPGEYDWISAEPYGFRYLDVLVLSGVAHVSDLTLTELVNPLPERVAFASSDPDLDRIFAAAIENLRQNALDLFFDCPHRERGGYPCDGWFTGRAMSVLTGHLGTESAFLENFAVADGFDDLPNGMVPMCYPSDVINHEYIPQWALWLIVQLHDYKLRGGDDAIVHVLRKRVEGILAYLVHYENEDGLLENLPGWNFIEWSKANEWVAGIHLPTSMLYGHALTCAGKLFDEPVLSEKGKKISRKATDLSWNGTVFRDQATRVDGKIEVNDHASEVAQYFPYFHETIKLTDRAEHWKALVAQFAPGANRTEPWASVAPANMFIGHYMRLEMLRRDSRFADLIDEIKGHVLAMAKETGTLWENDGAYASCNHGFASYVAALTVQAVFGIVEIDRAGRRIVRTKVQGGPASATARLLGPDGPIEMRREGEVVDFRLPAGYRLVTA